MHEVAERTTQVAQANEWWIHYHRPTVVWPETDVVASAQVADLTKCAKLIDLFQVLDFSISTKVFPQGIPIDATVWDDFAAQTKKTIHLVHNYGIDPFSLDMNARLIRTITP